MFPGWRERHNFTIVEYTDANFTIEADENTSARTTSDWVYLKLCAELEDGNKFAVRNCFVSDDNYKFEVLEEGSCKNDLIQMTGKYENEHYFLKHKLFLFNSKIKSTFRLTCTHKMKNFKNIFCL